MYVTQDLAEMVVTLAFLVLGLVLAGLMAWLERRPRRDFNPRLLPTTPIMFMSVLVVLVAAAHLLNLYGIKTGR
jgi:predicted permease